jgi:hypothetical protein
MAELTTSDIVALRQAIVLLTKKRGLPTRLQAAAVLAEILVRHPEAKEAKAVRL